MEDYSVEMFVRVEVVRVKVVWVEVVRVEVVNHLEKPHQLLG